MGFPKRISREHYPETFCERNDYFQPRLGCTFHWSRNGSLFNKTYGERYGITDTTSVDTRLISAMKYRTYSLRNFRDIPQIDSLSPAARHAISVVGQVFPFRVNNHVIDYLIDWDAVPDDPMFRLTFPTREMLLPEDFRAVEHALSRGDTAGLRKLVRSIHRQLNPHPASQLTENVPLLHGESVQGLQHKYRETVLVFPAPGQVCHAFCTCCFRWPQFVQEPSWKFGLSDPAKLREYLQVHREVSDVLFTGGDPGIMRTKLLRRFITPVLSVPHVQNIRIGTKALSYWPYRFLTDQDADDLMRLCEEIIASGRHLAVMAHFTHPVELEHPATMAAIGRLRSVGAEIRTQAPLLRHINDRAGLWARMWREQVRQGCVPYYLFIARNTGARHYFSVPLVRAWEIYRRAYKQVSGIARTVRGPVMSAGPGKIQVLGIRQVGGEQVFVLRMLQGRNPNWVLRPFFAKFDQEASWISDLQPPSGYARFFFENHGTSPSATITRKTSGHSKWLAGTRTTPPAMDDA